MGEIGAICTKNGDILECLVMENKNKTKQNIFKLSFYFSLPVLALV